ncbi:MAG: hypothetical protein AAF927_18880 [Bacteroidota bacterium]
MKYTLILLLCISTISASAQEVIERIREQRCPITFYKRTDSTDLKITKSAVKARATKNLLINYQCAGEAASLLNGEALYLVITDVDGKQMSNELYKPMMLNINSREIRVYAQGVYRENTGISFEIVPPGDKWQKDTTYIFRFCTEEGVIAKKILLFN